MIFQRFCMNKKTAFQGILLFLLSGITLLAEPISPTDSQPVDGITVEIQEKRVWEFPKAGVRFTNQFPGARLSDCTQTGKADFRILIRPENAPINNSAWYAFEVSSNSRQKISVTLAYEGGKHRFRPKISDDMLTWNDLPSADWKVDKERNEAVLTLSVGPKPLRVAGLEMIGSAELRGWINEMSQKAFIQKTTVGESMLGQSIEALRIGSPEALNYVFIISRQHPPEITGSLGMIHFVENLAQNSPQANEFRRHFQTVVIPLMNPDGVDHGHWRHNMAGVDLNRDWLKFAQPETRAARDFFTRLAAREGAQVYLFLDFHSTYHDVFYTQNDEHPTFPENFTAKWLSDLKEQMPEYKVKRSGSHSPTSVTSKGWGYETFGVPSITYEVGYNTDRDLIRRQTTVTSDEMMRLLLEAVKTSGPERREPQESELKTVP